jgi:hypothetical protein
MDTHSDHPDDLSELERRLSAWKPADDGLDADALLFDAGRASMRPTAVRFVWPALTGLLTALTVVLGLWLAVERSERLALARRLAELPPAPTVNTPLPPTAPQESAGPEEPSPDSYLAGRRALEQGLDAWPVRAVVRHGPPTSPGRNPPILHLGQRDALLDP